MEDQNFKWRVFSGESVRIHGLGWKQLFLRGRREQRNFFAFRFLWPLRSAWPNFLVKLRLLHPDVSLSSPSGTYWRSIATRIVASEMGGLVPPVMSSNSLNMCQYSTRKGFSQTREKVVDLKRKKLGEVPAQSCCWTWIASSQDWIYVEAKAILQKEHITLLRRKGYAFGAFWRISLVTVFETLTFLKGRPDTGN